MGVSFKRFFSSDYEYLFGLFLDIGRTAECGGDSFICPPCGRRRPLNVAGYFPPPFGRYLFQAWGGR